MMIRSLAASLLSVAFVLAGCGIEGAEVAEGELAEGEAETYDPVYGDNGLDANGLGRNGLGRNGLGRNGLGRNGLGRNGLGRNGVSSAEFKQWFDAEEGTACTTWSYNVTQSSRATTYSGNQSRFTDNNGDTGTATYSTGANWIKADFTAAARVTSVTVGGKYFTSVGSIAAAANGSQIQYSTNNSSWTTVATVSGVTDSGTSQFRTFTFAPISARYWRLYKSSGRVGTTELRFEAAMCGSSACTQGRALHDQVMKYLTSCALDTDQEPLTYTDVCGETHSWAGKFGLAPSWNNGPATTDEQELVSACLLAHINYGGQSVRLSLRGRHPSLATTPQEREIFSTPEAVYYGNLFEDSTKAYFCTNYNSDAQSSSGSALWYNEIMEQWGRECTDSNEPGVCGGVEYMDWMGYCTYPVDCTDAAGNENLPPGSEFTRCQGRDGRYYANAISVFMPKVYQTDLSGSGYTYAGGAYARSSSSNASNGYYLDLSAGANASVSFPITVANSGDVNFEFVHYACDTYGDRWADIYVDGQLFANDVRFTPNASGQGCFYKPLGLVLPATLSEGQHTIRIQNAGGGKLTPAIDYLVTTL